MTIHYGSEVMKFFFAKLYATTTTRATKAVFNIAVSFLRSLTVIQRQNRRFVERFGRFGELT